jgi:hypothetical protein
MRLARPNSSVTGRIIYFGRAVEFSKAAAIASHPTAPLAMTGSFEQPLFFSASSAAFPRDRVAPDAFRPGPLYLSG